jgi:hypothetical protein
MVELLKTKKYVVMSFDDARSNFYSVVFPLLKKYHLMATLNVTTGFVDRTSPIIFDSSCTIKQIQEMHRYGIEMALHGDEHLQRETIEDMSNAFDKLRSWTGIKPTGVAMPFNQAPSKELQSFFKKIGLSYCRVGGRSSKKSFRTLLFLRLLFKRFGRIGYFIKGETANFYKIPIVQKNVTIFSVPIFRKIKPESYLSLLDKMPEGFACTFVFHTIEAVDSSSKDSYPSGAWTESDFERFLLLCQKMDVVFLRQQDLFIK